MRDVGEDKGIGTTRTTGREDGTFSSFLWKAEGQEKNGWDSMSVRGFKGQGQLSMWRRTRDSLGEGQ